MGNQGFLEKLERLVKGNAEAEKQIEELKRRLGANSETSLTKLLNLGGLEKLFDGLGNLLELTVKMQESGLVEGAKEFDLGNGCKGMISHGFRIGPMARPGASSAEKFKVETSGNRIRKTEKGPVVEDVREPEVDVFEEGDGVVIVGDLPGVDESDIKCWLEGKTLKIETSGRRKYQKEVLIPFEAESATLEKSYKNGMLEIRLKRLKQNQN